MNMVQEQRPVSLVKNEMNENVIGIRLDDFRSVFQKITKDELNSLPKVSDMDIGYFLESILATNNQSNGSATETQQIV